MVNNVKSGKTINERVETAKSDLTRWQHEHCAENAFYVAYGICHRCVVFLPLCTLPGWFHPFFAHEKIYDPKKSRYNLQNSNRSVLFRRTQFPFQHGGARFCLLFTVGDQASDIRGKGSPDQRKAWTSAESLTEGKVMYKTIIGTSIHQIQTVLMSGAQNLVDNSVLPASSPNQRERASPALAVHRV